MENQFDKIPEHLKPKTSGTEQLFGSGILEKFTRTHISVPVTMHIITICIVSYFGLQAIHPGIFFAIFASGWLLWTFSEYWIHRYVYHVQTTNKTLLKIQHMGHGIHHQYPKDPTRLAMPPVPALLLLSIFFGLFWLMMQEYTLAFFPGFLFGYLLYISIHFAQHRYKPPKFKPLNRLWTVHLQHHYRFPEHHAFGVSTNLWDFVFGTMPPKN